MRRRARNERLPRCTFRASRSVETSHIIPCHHSLALIIRKALHSMYLPTDAVKRFEFKCVDGLKFNEKRMKQLFNESLMVVTALNPVTGYDKTSQIAKKADKEGSTLKEATMDLGFLSEQLVEEALDPTKMLGLK